MRRLRCSTLAVRLAWGFSMASESARRTPRLAGGDSGPGSAPGVVAARLLKELIHHQLRLLRSKQQLDKQQASDALRELIRQQLRKDSEARGRKGQPRLSGRMTVVHPVTFQRLCKELERPDAELGSDRQALVEAVAHLCAEPPFRGFISGSLTGELKKAGQLLPAPRVAVAGRARRSWRRPVRRRWERPTGWMTKPTSA
ncbi:hypothetical protein ACWEQ2_38265 [Streptomyces sp. NPDC004096]